MADKNFFKEPTAAKIRKYDSIRHFSKDLIYNILEMGTDQAAVINIPLIPERYSSPGKFMKHGPDVKLKRFRTLDDAVADGRTPVQLREEAFNNAQNHAYAGYTFKPIRGLDRRTRKVSLVGCLEGTKIYCYANQENPQGGFSPSIDVQPYGDRDKAQRVVEEGSDVILRVPSRTKKEPRHEFKMGSVPTVGSNKHKFAVANNIVTDHSCGKKKFNIRYKYMGQKETSRQLNLCEHEGAGYLALIDHYWTEDKNITPLEMSQFAIPTQETVDFYDKLCHNVLIQLPDENKPRKLSMPEREVLLWGLVYHLGHDKTFFATEKVRDYTWRQ